MIPILYDKTATDFSLNGLGRLAETIECRVTEEINGIFELELSYPMTGPHFGQLVHSAIILAKPAARRDPQAFRIYRISKPINGRILVSARHISYDLAGIPADAFSGDDIDDALSEMADAAAVESDFDFSTDIISSKPFASSIPASIRSLMGGEENSFLSVYGGEWYFDNFECALLSARGENTGYRIAYGKNLVDFDQEENIEATFTGVMPFWQSGSTLVELPEKIISVENADAFPVPRIEVLDLSTEFDAQPTAAQLRAAAVIYMDENNFGVPAVSLSVSFVNLPDTEEYKKILRSSNLDLGDTVTVSFPALGVEKEAEVVQIVYDTLKERYESIEIGEIAQSLADTIQEQQARIETMPTTAEVERSIDHATGILDAGRGGHAIFGRNTDGWADELYFLDSEEYAEAEKVLRINMNGIGFSSQGVEGPYSQAWTLDGVLSLGGVNDSFGRLVLLNSNGDEIGSFSAARGLEFTRGQKIGFVADGTNVRLGDFYIADDYGRQILQSVDERTGMSANPNTSGQLYLWAGWTDSSHCVFSVSNDNVVSIQGSLLYNGRPIEDLISEAYDNGYSDGYADGQQHPIPPNS